MILILKTATVYKWSRLREKPLERGRKVHVIGV
jgi:hypothetical protein